MRQAITTKFIAPTNSRPARIKATADAGSVTVSWDHSKGISDNHRAAALTLADKFAWPRDLIGGSLPGSGFAFVIAH